MCAGKGMGCVG
uniref:Putative ribose-5-phosphate isomerase 3ic n=1 Tax=Rhizophora mucronata TaxID=61149 RepID=A0A2P2IR36_RHIMU